MDFEFSEILIYNNNIEVYGDTLFEHHTHDLEHTRELIVYVSKELDKKIYKLRTMHKLFDDLNYFFHPRVSDCKNNQEGYVHNKFIVKIDFFDLSGEHVNFKLMTAKFNENGLKSFTKIDEDFFGKIFINMENKYCYKIYIIEIIKYLTSESETEEEKEIKPTIIKTFKEDKCIVCLENKPNMLYENCKHISTCSSCEEDENLNKCPICRSKTKLKFMI